MLRNLSAGVFVVAVVGSLAACAEEPPTETETKDDLAVPASLQTQKELGVTKWRVEPGDPGRYWVGGVGTDGKLLVDVVIVNESTPERGSIAYDVHGIATLHLTVAWNASHATSNVDDIPAADLTAGRAVLARMQEDIGAPSRLTTPSAVSNQSLDGRVSPQGGHVGGPLVRRDTQQLVDRGTCLLDRSGQGCAGMVLSITGGLLAASACILTGGGAIVGAAVCLATVQQAAGSVISAGEAGCKQRPCSQRVK